jgi:hypothetical protein
MNVTEQSGIEETEESSGRDGKGDPVLRDCIPYFPNETPLIFLALP